MRLCNTRFRNSGLQTHLSVGYWWMDGYRARDDTQPTTLVLYFVEPNLAYVVPIYPGSRGS